MIIALEQNLEKIAHTIYDREEEAVLEAAVPAQQPPTECALNSLELILLFVKLMFLLSKLDFETC